MARIVENPALAFRLARAIVSDVGLYNQDKLRQGIENDTLFDLLAEELEEGRVHFIGRISDNIPNREHLYNKAIVDVMIYQAGKIKSRIW